MCFYIPFHYHVYGFENEIKVFIPLISFKYICKVFTTTPSFYFRFIIVFYLLIGSFPFISFFYLVILYISSSIINCSIKYCIIIFNLFFPRGGEIIFHSPLKIISRGGEI